MQRHMRFDLFAEFGLRLIFASGPAHVPTYGGQRCAVFSTDWPNLLVASLLVVEVASKFRERRFEILQISHSQAT